MLRIKNKLAPFLFRQLSIGKSQYNFAVGVHELAKEEDFQRLVADNKRPVIIDFYATWCGPCKSLAPKFAKKTETSDGWDFVKVDIDKFQALAEYMEVQAVPTVLLIHKGEKLQGLNIDKLETMVKKAEELGKEN